MNARRSLRGTRRIRRGSRRGQGMVEFSFVFPIFLAIVFGMVVSFLWQAGIESDQFAAQEGVQASGTSGSTAQIDAILNQASTLALCYATTESFLPAVTMGAPYEMPNPTGMSCHNGSVPAEIPNPASSCPGGEPPLGGPPPSLKTMVTFLKNHGGSSQNIIFICSSYQAGVGSGNEQELTVTVTIAGYEPIPAPLPFIGDRIILYGQASETTQSFENT